MPGNRNGAYCGLHCQVAIRELDKVTPSLLSVRGQPIIWVRSLFWVLKKIQMQNWALWGHRVRYYVWPYVARMSIEGVSLGEKNDPNFENLDLYGKMSTSFSRAFNPWTKSSQIFFRAIRRSPLERMKTQQILFGDRWSSERWETIQTSFLTPHIFEILG